MVRRTDSRRRMLDSAAELFQAQGYHATGLTQLVAAGGAPRGSLYFHFPGGKEQLAAEAVRLSSERIAEMLSAVVAAAPDPAAAIAAVVDTLTTALTESDFQRGCPLATVALEAAAESRLIRQACDEGYRSWEHSLAEYFTRQGLPAERATSLATVVLASIEGALLFAKTRRDVAPLRAIAAHLHTTAEREFA
ncbi:TetR/AcrR family transcriptional regulator [Amycolatopsis sp. FDAARGOS 1241]|uniref:TetR/AcrR family transcriptional regulator n=1 Tax=Amycolatopsis sp. FDAARGOS 1241 TaxID=2778070 RepID=UPI001952322D|nr:TetR/AcrR family transcriptional regulator [Amycolatopsis sp. FDAARGOS 1241]QRP46808.1 TetR/AcrR family transcriptional regulator [Amycolatopsis sp. FDAARGOS 1241]